LFEGEEYVIGAVRRGAVAGATAHPAKARAQAVGISPPGDQRAGLINWIKMKFIVLHEANRMPQGRHRRPDNGVTRESARGCSRFPGELYNPVAGPSIVEYLSSDCP
jgi:hypothetical protein